jgi:hypothetical protein
MKITLDGSGGQAIFIEVRELKYFQNKKLRGDIAKPNFAHSSKNIFRI